MKPLSLGRAVRFLAWVSGPFAGMVAIACSATPGGEDDLGMARVALSQAPTDVRCLEITARGVRQVAKRFDVTPGTSSTFEMAGLPLGDVQFSGAAFQDACGPAATSMPTPTWVGDPVAATIVKGVIAQVTLIMRRNGQASVAVDFRDCAEGFVDLGSLSGASDISPADMNELGQVTGTTGVGAFLWDSGTMTSLGLGAGSSAVAINNNGQILAYGQTGAVLWNKAVAYAIGTLGADWAEVTAVNDSGQVVGTSATATEPGLAHAFLWQPGGGMVDLGTFGGFYSFAYAINAAGQVAGDSESPSTRDAFLWEAGTMRDLGSLGVDGSNAAALNDAGQVVGMSSTATGSHAFLWEAGAMRDLGTLPGGDWSGAVAVSSTGQVVGFSNRAPGADTQDTHAFLWETGVMHDLGTLGGATSSPGGRRAINDAGEVVGSSETALGEVHAFLWKSGTMHDLGTLGVPNTVALGINNAHQIFGYSSTSSGRQRGFFFNPSKCPAGDASSGGR